MKITKILTMAFCVLFSMNAYAKNNNPKANDYDSGAYEAEGRIIVKIRGAGIIAKGTYNNLPASTNSPAVKNDKLVKSGFAIENANTLFFTDNIAAELGVGMLSYNNSTTAINSIYKNYGNSSSNPSVKKSRLMGFPLTFTMQYHIAPFGGIRPYIGAGYNFTYFTSKSQAYKISPSHGLAFQLGTDIVMTDDSLVNIDIKQYYGTSKITYKSGFLNQANNLSAKVKMNPITFAIGVGFKI